MGDSADMLDVAPTELILVAIVALLVIGPKDLPKAMRFVGLWLGKARGVARQFRSGFDTMVREAELSEMEAKWKAENERIMREHPPQATAALFPPAAAVTANGGADMAADPETPGHDHHAGAEPGPLMVEQPLVAPAAPETPASADDGKAVS